MPGLWCQFENAREQKNWVNCGEQVTQPVRVR
jgi:hypothetical protein